MSHLPLDPQNVPVLTDVLRTMLAGVQKIINARPLTPVKASTDDCDAVAPSSLLHHQLDRPTNPIRTFPTRESLLRDHVMFKKELTPSGRSGYSCTYTIYRSVTAKGLNIRIFKWET